MIEKYITVLAFLIVLRGILIFPYLYIMQRTNLKTKGRKFIPNRLFASYDINLWRIFWLSALWLTIKYWDMISGVING